MLINNCPECGQKAKVGLIEKLNDFYVECPSCKYGGPKLFLDKQDVVISKWNKHTNLIKGKRINDTRI